MPYELLNQLCTAQLPQTFSRQTDICKLQTLRGLGLIEADIPDLQAERSNLYTAGAIVMSVTPQGRASAADNKHALPGGGVAPTPPRGSVPSPYL